MAQINKIKIKEMKTKAQFKELKKRITEETAVNVGYYTEILSQLPEYALF